jgi:hypothetical protein
VPFHIEGDISASVVNLDVNFQYLHQTSSFGHALESWKISTRCNAVIHFVGRKGKPKCRRGPRVYAEYALHTEGHKSMRATNPFVYSF